MKKNPFRVKSKRYLRVQVLPLRWSVALPQQASVQRSPRFHIPENEKKISKLDEVRLSFNFQMKINILLCGSNQI